MLEAGDHRVDRLLLILPRGEQLRFRGPQLLRGGGPDQRSLLQTGEQDPTHRLLLRVRDPQGVAAETVRHRNQEPVGELGARRLGKERVQVPFRDRVALVVRLRLDRPQVAAVLLGD